MSAPVGIADVRDPRLGPERLWDSRPDLTPLPPIWSNRVEQAGRHVSKLVVGDNHPYHQSRHRLRARPSCWLGSRERRPQRRHPYIPVGCHRQLRLRAGGHCDPRPHVSSASQVARRSDYGCRLHRGRRDSEEGRQGVRHSDGGQSVGDWRARRGRGLRPIRHRLHPERYPLPHHALPPSAQARPPWRRRQHGQPLTSPWASRLMRPVRSLTRRWAPARTLAARDRQPRLLRWATLLERNPHQIIGLLSPSWAGGDARGTMVDRPSAIDVAWSDVVLRVMGLAGRSRGEAKSFFGLSDAELDRIAAGSWRCPVRPAWQVAVRIRNVECPRLENRIVGSVVALLLVICAISYWIFLRVCVVFAIITLILSSLALFFLFG